MRAGFTSKIYSFSRIKIKTNFNFYRLVNINPLSLSNSHINISLDRTRRFSDSLRPRIMFTNMLRPSRRHAHERISQNEDNNPNVANDNNNNDSNNNSNNVNNGSTADQPTIVVIGGEESGIGNDQHDFNFDNLTGAAATPAGAASTDENGESDGASQLPVTPRGNVIRASNDRGSNNNSSNSSNSSNDTNNGSSDANENLNNENSPRLGTDGIIAMEESSDASIATEEGTSPRGTLESLESIALQQHHHHPPDPTTATLTNPFLLHSNQIQTERDIRYRRQSTCTLLILFFLIRLWIEAIMNKDVGLIFLSMMGTTWTYRWFVSRREAEEAYDLQIGDGERNDFTATMGLGGENNNRGGTTMGNTGADAAVDFDPDLGLMSFQAQLALAILESQRQMFENGGYGGNDRSNNGTDDGPGVTSEAKEKWKSYVWGKKNGGDDEEMAELAGLTRCSSAASIIKKSTSNDSNYGSVSTAEDDDNYDANGDENENNHDGKTSSSASKMEGGLLEKKKSFDTVEEQPSCSICLCEYEPGDKVIRLPCDHVYHESCLNSWTDGHVRCPLCNYDLMEGYEQPPSVRRARQHAEEQRAFRNMALSTLGRRTVGRRSTRASTAAALMAAAEDSIV